MSKHRTFALVSGTKGERIVLCGLLDVDCTEAERLIQFHGIEEFMKDDEAKKHLVYQGLHLNIIFMDSERYVVGYIFKTPFFWDTKVIENVLEKSFDVVVFGS